MLSHSLLLADKEVYKLKKVTRCISLVVFFAMIFTSAQAATLFSYFVSCSYYEGYQTFAQAHPDVSVQTCSQYYETTSTFANALNLGELTCDLFGLDTLSYDWSSLMEKGYCADLSDSTIISNIMSQL